MTLSRDRARPRRAGPARSGYVRALREQRYSGRPAAPTAEQRRGLRAALARDAGLLRSWWALPAAPRARHLSRLAPLARRARRVR